MNKKMRALWIGTMFLFGILAFHPATKAFAQDRFDGTTITGTVYFIGGRRPGLSLPFTLIINRTTPPNDISQLNSALAGGQDDLMRSLTRLDAGRIQIGNNVGVTANAIMVTDQGDGRTKITVLYQRFLQFSELRYGARSQDYPFGYAELNVGRGANEGMLIPAARVRLRGNNTWEVEDFGTFPARLMGLRVRGGRGNVR